MHSSLPSLARRTSSHGRLRSSLIVIAIFATPAAAQAPLLRGIVRDSTSGEPVTGAVITVLDSAGRESTHTIAGADGRFRITRPSGAARLRARRIGFRPRELPISAGAPDDTVALEIDMGRVPQMLASVRVTGVSHCPGSTDEGEAAQLWDQARDGLLASIVARNAMPARAEVVMFNRTLAPRDDRVVLHRHRTTSGRATNPFRATASAAMFARLGYVHEDAGGRTFNAPDADVLLDESFAATHCFRLLPGSGARADQIGLAFRPARSRRGIVDVDGVLWLDRARPALRTLEFRYTELDRVSTDAHAGGVIEFGTMSNGVVIITRWSLRMPVAMARSRSRASPGFSNTRPANDLTLAEIRESGGLVIAATWPDGVRWSQAVAVVEGAVAERGSRRPIGHALVTFAGSNDTVATDSTGRFALTTVLPGRYDVIAMDTSLAGYVEGRSVRRTIDVPEHGIADIDFELPPREESIRRLCADERMRPLSSVLLGRLRRAGGGVLGRVEVRVSWQDDIAVRSGGVAVREAQRTIDPDPDGRFHVCGVVRERPVRIVVRRGEVTVADTAVFVHDSTVQRVDVDIPSSSEPGTEPPSPPKEWTGGRGSGQESALAVKIRLRHVTAPSAFANSDSCAVRTLKPRDSTNRAVRGCSAAMQT